jgi:hypothetical protein
MGRVPYGRTGSFLISLIMATSKVDFFYIIRVGFFVPKYLVLFSRNVTWKVRNLRNYKVLCHSICPWNQS